MMIIVPISPRWHQPSFGISVDKRRGRVRIESLGEWVGTLSTQRLTGDFIRPPRSFAALLICLTGLNFSSRINAEGADENPCRYSPDCA